MKPKEPAAILQKNRAVLKDQHVKALYLFGSFVRGEDKPGSDVDILVEFQPEARVGLFGLARCKWSFCWALGWKGDFLGNSNPFSNPKPRQGSWKRFSGLRDHFLETVVAQFRFNEVYLASYQVRIIFGRAM